MRGATHPGPENTYFLATQCCRSDEKQTERKSETKKTRGELHECKTKIRATASSWHSCCCWRWWWCQRKWGWEDVFHVVSVCVWCKGTLTEARQSKYGYMISTLFLFLTPPPPPSFFHQWHSCRHSFFSICANLEHLSSKHIPFLLIFFPTFSCSLLR